MRLTKVLIATISNGGNHLPPLLRRADAGEAIVDTLDFEETPEEFSG